MPRYHYITIPFDDIEPILRGIDPEAKPDAYVADDAPARILRDLLAKGYRWVRTDGDFAIFEQAIYAVSAAKRRAL